MDLRERGEATASGRRRNLSGVNRSNQTGESSSNAGDESAKHEKRIVSGETHENSSEKEESGGESHGVTAANQIGDSPGGSSAKNRVQTYNPNKNLHLHVGDPKILLNENHRSTHHTHICFKSITQNFQEIICEKKKKKKS